MNIFSNDLRIETSKGVVAFIALLGYSWIVFIFQAIARDIEMTWLFATFLGMFSAILSLFAFYIFDKIDGVDFYDPTPSRKECMLGWMCVFLITLVFFMMYFAANYPGGMSPDTISQYNQALTGRYNDWHPALQTMLFFTIPLLAGRSLGFIVFLQLFYFCLAFSYLVYVLYREGCPKLLLCIICVYVWINPFLATYLMYPWKDISLVIFAVLLVAYYTQIVASKGTWLQKKKNILFFSAAGIAATYMRHNAILFVAPLVVTVFFYCGEKRQIKAWLVVALLVCYLLVKALYSYLNVAPPGGRTIETVGLPATVWCNVMKKNPDVLPEKTKEVMYSVASPEVYQKYKSGIFNSIKWGGKGKSVDKEKIDSMSYKEVMVYTWQCFRYAPKESIEALAKLTSLVWGIDGRDGPISVGISKNKWKIQKSAVPLASTFLEQMTKFFSLGVGRVLFGSYGVMLWVLFAIGLVLFAKGKITIIHFAPLFCYNFGTMLLLSGRDYRFFLLNIPLWIPTIFLMYKDETTLP